MTLKDKAASTAGLYTIRQQKKGRVTRKIIFYFIFPAYHSFSFPLSNVFKVYIKSYCYGISISHICRYFKSYEKGNKIGLLTFFGKFCIL